MFSDLGSQHIEVDIKSSTKNIFAVNLITVSRQKLFHKTDLFHRLIGIFLFAGKLISSAVLKKMSRYCHSPVVARVVVYVGSVVQKLGHFLISLSKLKIFT